MSRRRGTTITVLTAMGALVLGGCVETRSSGLNQPETISLGRNAAGEPCTATRTWSDPAVTDVFDVAYSMTCRNVAANRPVGTIRLVATSAETTARIEKSLQCGAAKAVTLPAGSRAASVRRCFDSLLGGDAVAITTTLGNRTLIAVGTTPVVGPLEEGVAIIAGDRAVGADQGRTNRASIELASLGALPASAETAVLGATLFDPEAALVTGIGLNHKGLHVEASRTLNDALSRLSPTASPALLADLQLEAALADSNIRFDQAAAEHFARADEVMQADAGARTSFLIRKRETYRALDLLNRRQFRAALRALEAQASAPASRDRPLRDLATVRAINQGNRSGDEVSSSVGLPDTALLSQIVLDAQVAWARSAALVALGDLDGAKVALDTAEATYAPLKNERIDQVPVLWLGSRIDRQRARLAARRGDWATAISNMDTALEDLRRSAIATQGTGNEPAIAELQLERASMIARRGGDPENIRNEYGRAVDALIAAGNSGGALPLGLEGYLDLLITESGANLHPDTYERYFRAMQGTGEPALARQLSQLQAVVASDQDVGVQIRDRAEVERDITRLRYAIADAQRTGVGDTGALETERQAAETKLSAIDTKLASDPRYRTVDDRPATVADIRAVLKPGEGFLKFSEVNQRLYGIYVTADQTFIYAAAATPAATRTIDTLANDVRASIDGQLAEGKLVQFADDKAYVLFRLFAGPARDAILAASSLVVDPAGPLEKLPIGVLVTSYDANAKRADALDYSGTAFLATKTALSVAVSPRSFLVARSLAPSRARQPFLGLGEHQQPAMTAPASQMVNVGFGCTVPLRTLQGLSRQLAPISSNELSVAATALGVPNAPMMIDGAFSDTGVEARTDLADFEVLHFATHGLEEGVWGCAKSPPALVTSFGAGASDGLLSFSEIAGLRLDANLVVLSACDTASGIRNQALARASGQEESGATLEGLVRAFLTANARAVMATYWQASAGPDSVEFMQTFYASARGEDIGESLQAAQRVLIAQPKYSHPFFWGPFFIVGDSTKMMLSGAAPQVASR